MRKSFPFIILGLVAGLLVQLGVVPQAAMAVGAAEPLPRAYRVDGVAEVPGLHTDSGRLALSADGTTALHLSPRGDDPPALVATDLGGGGEEAVGLDLQGLPVQQVRAAAISGDGRTVAFLATASSSAELRLPATADPNIREAIFVRDRLTGATTWVQVPDLGVPVSDHTLLDLDMSADGTRLAVKLSLPLPEYESFSSPEGVLLVTLSAGAAPVTHVVRPEDFRDGGAPVRDFALSGDGKVLAVNAGGSPGTLMRFDTTSGDKLPGERDLTQAQQNAWVPNLDQAGRRTAFGGVGAGVVVADLVTGPSADVTLDASPKAPYVSGDTDFGPDDLPTWARLSADGGTVAFRRSGALWTQPAQAGRAPALASPGLDGRIADPVVTEGVVYPDLVYAYAMSADAGTVTFLSSSTAFVAPRTDEPQPPHLYRAVPADAPAPTWPEGAELTAEPGTTSVNLSWPAASATARTYDVSVNGTKVTTVTTTQTVLTGLTAGSTVDLAVVARDADGRASAPLTRSVTLQDGVPPGQAPLSAVSGPGARVRLTWEASGSTGYRVLRDGVKLADLAPGVTTYDDVKVAADTEYTYAIAVLRGTEQIPLTKDARVRIDTMTVTETAANLPKVAGSTVLALGREATFALVGAAGFTATADLVVRTADDPAKPVTVELKEEPAGRYRGSWPLPEGVTEIVSGTVKIADGAGHSLSRPVTGLPATVGGLIRVGVTVPGGQPDGVRLQVWSDTTGTGYVAQPKENGIIAVPVVPAADHKITTRRSDGLDGTPPKTVTVASGQVVEVALAPYGPASLTLTLRRPGGEALADVPVVLTTVKRPLSARTDANGRVTFGTLDAATEVTAKIAVPAKTLADHGLAAVPDRTVTLVPGNNVLAVDAVALPKVTVRGTVKDADGRPLRAEVVLRQKIGGVGVSTRTESAPDGTWSAEVHGGTPTVASATRARWTTDETEVGTGPVELVFPEMSAYVIRPKLITVSLEGERSEQVLDNTTAQAYQPHVLSGGERRAVHSAQAPVDAPPGATVSFCADGAFQGLGKACAEAVTGDSPDIPMTVEIHETSRITARVLEPDGTPRVGNVCPRLEGNGSASYPDFVGPGLRMSVPAAGSYVLTVRACRENPSGSVQRLVTVRAGEQLNLGDLVLDPGTGLVQGKRSGFGAIADTVLPGEAAHLRADIEFQDTTRAGTARLAIPPGVTVPDGGVLRDGKPVAFAVEGNAVVIPLPAAKARTIDVYVRTPQTAGNDLPFSMTVSSGDLTEHLGSAAIQVGVVTLGAPASSKTGRFTTSGLAPAGAHVAVRDGDTVIAEADAGAGGRWHAIVDVGTGPESIRHTLRASATVGAVELDSDPATVTVDPYASVLETVTMSQQGTSRTFHPADGVARFPWVWGPHFDVRIEARFSGPVEHPQADLGTLDLALTPVAGKEHVYAVSTRPAANEVGDLTITYTPGRDRPQLPLPEAPDSARGLFDPATAVLDDPVTEGAAVSQRFTAPIPKLGPNAQGRFKLTIEPLPDYEPDAAALAASRRSGVPVYGPVVTGSDPRKIAETGRYTAEVVAIVDIGALPDSPLVRKLNAAGFITGPARVAFQEAFELITDADSLYSAETGGDKYDQLNQMMDMAVKCQDWGRGYMYRERLEELMKRALALDVYNAVSSVTGLVFAPATFGVSAAVWAVTWVLGKAIEISLNDDIDELRRQMNGDQKCRWPSRDTSTRDPNRPRPDADIDYRFDPSGYLYEGLDERRVSGVTATLMRAPAAEGPWQVYDASVYGDLNPQVTDDEGRYGWDVPEGWWKVVYTKDGYLPAESRALKVLPPHTDVNVSLLRADLAEVSKIEVDGEGLTVTMTQPTKVSQALSGALTVTTVDGAAVGGQWTAVAPKSDTLAMAFRFTGEKRTGEVKVAVDGLLQDHGGRAIADGVAETLDVRWTGPDTAGPQVSVTGVTDGATYRLHSVPVAKCVTVDRGSGVATQATLTLTGGTPAGVGTYTATCSGAKDNEGNVTPPVTATYSVVYVFTGFAAPIQNDGVVNTFKAGQGIQIKWRLTDASGAPINGLTTAALTVSPFNCQTGQPTGQGRVPAEGADQLQVLGHGSYQVIWRTPRSYADTCLTLHVDTGEGAAASHTAQFHFTRNGSQ
ncbi:PxKF domain-containing protein [Herbidospora sp. RD11066]